MSYEVLARKWRPQTFDDVVGQPHVLQPLLFQLSSGHLHPAILFTGTRGVGKTTLARLFAKSLNCETNGVSDNPCNQCSACTDIMQGRYPDLIEVDAASRTRVEDTLELLENANYLPSRGRFKIYLIDEVHMLSNSSFNALLKTLEEPPEHVKFILATTDPQKLPITVLSRCLQFSLRAIPPELIGQHLAHILTQEQTNFDQTAVNRIAQAARGSMRDAQTLLDQAIAFGQGAVTIETVNEMLGTLSHTLMAELFMALIQRDAEQLFQHLALAESRSLNYDTILVDMLEVVQATALMQFDRSPIAPVLRRLGKETVMALRTVSSEDLQIWYQIILQGRKDQLYAVTPYHGFEMTWIRLLAFKPTLIERHDVVDWSVVSGSALQTGVGERASKADAATSASLSPPSPDHSQTSLTALTTAEVELSASANPDAAPSSSSELADDTVPGLVTAAGDSGSADADLRPATEDKPRRDMPAPEMLGSLTESTSSTVEVEESAEHPKASQQVSESSYLLGSSDSQEKSSTPEMLGSQLATSMPSTDEWQIHERSDQRLSASKPLSDNDARLTDPFPEPPNTVKPLPPSRSSQSFGDISSGYGHQSAAFDAPIRAFSPSNTRHSSNQNQYKRITEIPDEDFSIPSDDTEPAKLREASVASRPAKSDAAKTASPAIDREKSQDVALSGDADSHSHSHTYNETTNAEALSDQHRASPLISTTAETKPLLAESETLMLSSMTSETPPAETPVLTGSSMTLSDEHWPTICKGLPVPGFAKSLASHCVFHQYDDRLKMLSLWLSDDADILLTDMAERALHDALKWLYGEDLQLHIRVATAAEREKMNQQTPEEQRQHAEQSSRQALFDSMKADPNIQEIESTFGLELKPNQIRPNRPSDEG